MRRQVTGDGGVGQRLPPAAERRATAALGAAEVDGDGDGLWPEIEGEAVESRPRLARSEMRRFSTVRTSRGRIGATLDRIGVGQKAQRIGGMSRLHQLVEALPLTAGDAKLGTVRSAPDACDRRSRTDHDAAAAKLCDATPDMLDRTAPDGEPAVRDGSAARGCRSTGSSPVPGRPVPPASTSTGSRRRVAAGSGPGTSVRSRSGRGNGGHRHRGVVCPRDGQRMEAEDVAAHPQGRGSAQVGGLRRHRAEVAQPVFDPPPSCEAPKLMSLGATGTPSSSRRPSGGGVPSLEDDEAGIERLVAAASGEHGAGVAAEPTVGLGKGRVGRATAGGGAEAGDVCAHHGDPPRLVAPLLQRRPATLRSLRCRGRRITASGMVTAG